MKKERKKERKYFSQLLIIPSFQSRFSMKPLSFLLALCALLPAVSCAGAICSCTGGEIASDDAVKNALGVLTVYGKSCGETSFTAYPYVECTGFEEAKERKDCVTNVIVRNESYADPIEEVPVSFELLCDHKKTVRTDGSIRIFYEDGLAKGEDANKTSSIHWRVSLGNSSSGRGAGRLRIDAEDFSPSLWSPSALVLDAPAVRDVVMKAPPYQSTMRQILSDESFVEILDESTNGYSIVFYDPSAIVGTHYEYFYRFRDSLAWITLPSPITNNLDNIAESIVTPVYEIAEDAVPFVRYNIEKRSASSFRITGIWRNAEPFYREFSYSNDVWTSSENGVRWTRVSKSTLGSDIVKTWTTEDSSGHTAFERRVFTFIGGRQLPSEITLGTGSAAVTTRQFYFTNATIHASFGKLRRSEGPNGSWFENEYDSAGRLSSVRSGWLSGGTNAPCRHVVYSYAPLFSATNAPPGLPVDGGSAERTTPRMETVYIGEIPVEKTLRAIHKDTLGYIRVETVRLLDPTVANCLSAWTDPANPHSLAIYMPENYGMPCSKLPWLVVNPDGTATSYDYISGDYVPGADGTPGVFTQVRGGPYFRTIATHGTAESFGIDSMGCSTNYAGIPLRTTRDVKLELRTGKREVLRETQVCNATGGYETVSWTTTTLDDLGHVVSTRSSDGSRTENEWRGDRLVASTGADGIRTTYAYDGLGRRVSSSYVDPLTGVEVVSSTSYDAAGRVLASTTTAGGLSQSTQRRYDGAGRLVWSRASDGIESTTAYGMTNGLHFVTTSRGADGLFATSATYSYADGKTAYTKRNGKRAETYVYGYADGLQWTIAYEGPKGTNSPVWTASVSDALGHIIRELRPGFGGSILETSYAYSAAGQLLSSEEYTLSAEATPRTPQTPREILAQSMASQGSLRSLRSPRENQTLRSRTLNLYDALGSLRVTAQDVNLNGVIDFAGPDIVSSNETSYVFLDSAWWRETSRYSFPDSGSAAPLRASTTRTRLSGLGVSETTELGSALLASETRAVDALGNVATQKTYRDRISHTSFTFSTSPDSALSAWSLSIGGHTVSNRTTTGILSSRDYDALGRVVTQTDGRGNTTTLAYDSASRLASTTDATGATTAYGYDALGRQTSVTNALSLVTTTAYDLNGNVISQRGAQYPVDYTYDDFGRMVTMSTYRNEDLSHPDVTTWLYEEATGLVTNKVYADGKGPSYDYTPEGRLSRRTWARGVTTDYAYDNQNRLISKTYSDSTPAVSLAYNRLGHPISAICAGVSTNRYAYNRFGQLTNELQNGTTITRSYDSLGRETGYALGESGGAGGSPAAVGTEVEYGYDSLGRFASVTSGDEVFTYGYIPGSSLVDSVANNHGLVRTTTYEPHRNLIATVENAHSNNVISRFDYENDAIGRRTAITRSGSAFSSLSGSIDHYGYNDRSELVSAHRTLDGEEVRGFSFGYAYDPIGNRTSSTEWDENGVPLTSHYTANELNEYESRTVPGHVTVLGESATDSTINVNGNPAWRKGAFFAGGDDFDNASSNVFAEIATAAVRSTAEVDEVESSTGNKFLPQTPETFTYDDDGNMTSDGRFNYMWDAENRLIAAETRADLVPQVPRVRVENAYDHRFRRIAKVVKAEGVDGCQTLFIYDGWNIVAAEHRSDTKDTQSFYVYGLDLIGTLHELGSIGGLVLQRQNGFLAFPMFDANGNILHNIRPDGHIHAFYDYSPFGELSINKHHYDFINFGFSSKYYDTDTGLNYYGYRFYSSNLGRWMNRDTVAENGGINLFGRARNSLVNTFDPTGKSEFTEESAREILEEKIEDWRKDGWDFAADALQQFLDNGNVESYKNADLSQYANMISENSGWRYSFLEHLKNKAEGADSKTPDVRTHVGGGVYARLQEVSSEELVATRELWNAFPPLFHYRFDWPGELFYALAGSHYSYDGDITFKKDCLGIGCVRYELQLDLKVLMVDLTTYPSGVLRNRAKSYRAARFLETDAGYNQPDAVFALWADIGTWMRIECRGPGQNMGWLKIN